MVRASLKVRTSPLTRVMVPLPSAEVLMAETASPLLAKFSMVPFSMMVGTGWVSTTSMSWRPMACPLW